MGRFGGDVQASLDHCEYAGPPEARRECFDGVFMENAVRATSALGASSAPGVVLAADTDGEHAHHDGHSDAATASVAMPMVREGDPSYPCSSIGAPYQASCWSYQPIIALAQLDGDAERAAAVCAAAGAAGTDACDQGLGKQMLGRRIDEPGAAAAMCRALGGRRTTACLAGIVEGLLDTDWRGTVVAPFCASLQPSERAACNAAIEERKELLVDDHSRHAGSGGLPARGTDAP
jgi:hypothetical protein